MRAGLHENMAGGNGGAVFLNRTALMIIEEVEFKQNVADSSRGALYMEVYFMHPSKPNISLSMFDAWL